MNILSPFIADKLHLNLYWLRQDASGEVNGSVNTQGFNCVEVILLIINIIMNMNLQVTVLTGYLSQTID